MHVFVYRRLILGGAIPVIASTLVSWAESLSKLAGISSVKLYDCGLLPRQGGTNTNFPVIPVAAVSIIRQLGPAPIQHGIAPIVKHRSLNASQK